MSDEHGWPDHHGDQGFEHHDDIGLPGDDPLPDLSDLHDRLPDEEFFDDVHDSPPVADHGVPDHDVPDHGPAGWDDPGAQVADVGHDLGTVGADPDVLADTDDPAPLFPPVVDVGPLPEPVDGFPWIDTGSLGLVDPAAVHPPAGAPDPQELADYAATDLPPGVDPWAALADSDDPATSALARWWSGQGQ